MFRRALVLFVVLVTAAALFAATPTPQDMLYGERTARVRSLCDSVLTQNADDTTAWIPFGTHYTSDGKLVNLRTMNPRRFVLFAWIDTANAGNATDSSPNLLPRLQIALDTSGFSGDSLKVYENQDSTCTLDTLHFRSGPIGSIMPLPVYGGGYYRLILAVDDTVRVKASVWEIH